MKTKIKLIGIAFGIIAIASCSKKEISQPCNSNTCAYSSSNLKLIANPYDYAGEFHNAILDIVVADPGYPNLTNLERYNIAVTFLTPQLPAGITLPSFNTLNPIVEEALSFSSIEDLATDLFSKGFITQKQKQLLNELNTITTTSSSVEQVVHRLEQFDNATSHRNDLTEDEKILLFVTSSILGHSIQYWGLEPTGSNERPKWLNDAIGAVGGFIGGFIIGGPVVGVFAAVICGDIGSTD